MWTSLADPIGVPKMFVVTTLSAWLLGLVLTAVVSDRIRKFSVGQWAVGGFALGILIAATLTDVKFIAFFGAIQRNDGAFSYIAFAILSFSAMLSFGPSNLRQIRNWILTLGSLLTLYGLMQATGNDPVRWTLLYNPIMGTLGNPDFFSGIVGVAAIASVWLIIRGDKIWLRGWGFLLLLVELFVLKRCASTQGEVAFFVGLTLLSIVRIWQFQKRAGLITAILISLASLPVFLGFLNAGPLASHLYRGTINNRLDYWRAAISMFKTHLLDGVGIDRFGEYYGQYAPKIQVVQGQPSDNAHNVFLQLAATGGLIVIIPYLLLVVTIFISAIRAVRSSIGGTQIDVFALFSIWLGLLLVSSISIDNLGVAIWFWISGGALYGVSQRVLSEGRVAKSKVPKGKSGKHVLLQEGVRLTPIASIFFVGAMLYLMIPSLIISAKLFALQNYRSGWSTAQFESKITDTQNTQPDNIQIRIYLADLALRGSDYRLGTKLVDSILKQDPRSINGYTLGAAAYEQTKRYELALPYRLRLFKLNPGSTGNMLLLVKDYVALKDLAKAREMSSRLSQLYPNSLDAKSAEALLKG